MVAGVTITPRMDGTALERAHWRIAALREMLGIIGTVDTRLSPDAPKMLIETALSVDDYNAKLPGAPEPKMCRYVGPCGWKDK